MCCGSRLIHSAASSMLVSTRILLPLNFAIVLMALLAERWVVAASDVRKLSVSSSFDFGRGIGFVRVSVFEWVCAA